MKPVYIQYIFLFPRCGSVYLLIYGSVISQENDSVILNLQRSLFHCLQIKIRILHSHPDAASDITVVHFFLYILLNTKKKPALFVCIKS